MKYRARARAPGSPSARASPIIPASLSAGSYASRGCDTPLEVLLNSSRRGRRELRVRGRSRRLARGVSSRTICMAAHPPRQAPIPTSSPPGGAPSRRPRR